MKPIFLSVLALCLLTEARSQQFQGYRSGNYTGVNGVFWNPANIADSKYRFDVNLFSISSFVGNDNASFKLKDISKSFEIDSLENQFLGKNSGPSSGMILTDIHGPSVMFNVGKNSFALTTRARIMANVVDIDGKLLDKLSSDLENDPELPYSINSSENMRLSANAWTEFGVSYGREIYSKDNHYLKAGITLKYLAGVANAYTNINNFNATIEEDLLSQDAYLSNTTGRLGVGIAGVSLSDFDVNDLTKMESRGFGGDLGVVYEYRPGGNGANASPYKFKLGVALLDIGRIQYSKDPIRSGTYDVNITGNERFYLNELEGQEIDNYNEFFAARPQFFTPSAANAESEYNVSLPSTIHIDADYNVRKNLYISLAGQVPLSSNEEKVFNNQFYSALTLTPRYEGRVFGFYLPLNYNSLTSFNAGASLRVGPFFIGSGSVLTALLSDSKQADFHVGFRFGGLRKAGK